MMKNRQTDHASEGGAMSLQSIEVGYQHVDGNPEERNGYMCVFRQVCEHKT